MNKNIIIAFLAVVFLLASSPRTEAFVPQTPHLLYLMVKKIKAPAGLVVHQTRKINQGTTASVASAGTTGSVDAVEGILGETLTFAFPGNLRSDIFSEAGGRFYAISNKGFVRVSDGVVASLEKSGSEFYTDPLLYRHHETLALQLTQAGVNTDKVTFQRFDGQVCYFIGQPPLYQNRDENQATTPGLWLDKDSFFPVRYQVQQKDWIVDIRYKNWERVSRTWYPMETRIYIDGDLLVEIEVSSVELKSGFSSALFDVDRILRQYPLRQVDQGSMDTHNSRKKTLDKQIEDFSKLYD